MADELQAGTAYVQVLPSMRGYQRGVQSEVSRTRITQDIEPQVDSAALARARAQMQKAAAQVEQARRKEADAAGAVRTAEAQLADVRDRADAKASQIVAAEERVAAARRRAEAAAEALSRAESANRSATGRVERLEIRADSRQADSEVRGFADRTVDVMESLGGKVKLAAAAALTAGGAALGVALVGAINVEAAQGLIRAQLGLTEAESARVGAIAGGLFRDAYGESIDDVNAAIRGLITNVGELGSFSDAELTSMGAKALDLARIMGEDVGRVTRGVGQLMRNELAPNATVAFDLITAAAQRLPAEMQGELLDTIEEYSADLRQLGLTGPQALGAISAAVQAGARNTDLAADAFREFSIRALDGSKLTAQGFQMLGLNAEDMVRRIAAGGPTAAAATSEVIRALAGVGDAAKQEQAGVALFGTRFEELGIKAIAAMDPAAAALGSFAGAADAAGQALNDNASTEIETWKRAISGAFVDVLGGVVLPILSGVAGFLGTVFGPALSFVGGLIRDNAGWLMPLAVGLATFATGIGLVNLAMTAWAARTRAVAAAQAVLNAVMAANPIGLIVLAVAALVAGLIYAYQHSETFREIVQAAWSGIATAASWAWNTILKPIFDFFVAAWGLVATAATWLWSNVLSPVFGFIGLAARVLAAIVLTVLVTPVVLAFQLLAAVGMWLWTNAIKPSFDAIGAAATWLWSNAIEPAMRGIGAVVTWLYTNVIKPYIDFWVAAFHLVADVAMWLWTNAIRPAFDGVGAVVSSTYNGVLRPVFDAIMGAVRAVGDAFRWAVDRIGEAWGRIQGIVRPPVDFVVNVVYNRGIRPAWNFIGGLFGLGQLPEYRFARGGLVPGYAPGRDVVPALLSPGEAVLVPEAVRALGPANILALNAAARRGRAGGPARPEGDFGHLADRRGVARFAEGGIVSSIGSWLWDKVGRFGDFVGGVADFISDPVGSVRRVFADLDTSGLGGAGQLSEALRRIPGKVIDAAIEKIKGETKDAGGAAGAPAALAFAMSQRGKPYVWGGGGPGGYDCSGFMAAITNVLRGRSPYGRLGTTATMPWAGFRPGMSPIFTIGNSRNTGSGIGHMAGTLLGVNVESRGSRGVVVGPAARGATNGLFGQRYAFAHDQGGLASGRGILLKDVIAPERVLSPRQTAAFEQLVPLLERLDPAATAAPVLTPAQLAALTDTGRDGGRSGDQHLHFHEVPWTPERMIAEADRRRAYAARTR